MLFCTKRFLFFSLSLVIIHLFIIQNITNWFAWHEQWGMTMLGETGGCNLWIIFFWDIGHPPYSRSCHYKKLDFKNAATCLYSASKVQWGGEVVNGQIGGQHTTTQMSSGHFVEEGPNMASFFRNLKVIINGQQVTSTDTDES